MKKTLTTLLIGASLAFAGSVFAAQITVPSATSYGQIPVGLSTGNYTPLATSTLKINTSDTVEGSNLYYLDSRVQTFLNTLSKGYFFSTTSADAWDLTKSRWATTSNTYWLSQQTTDGLAQGSTNKYFSNSLVDTWLGTKNLGVFWSTTSADYWGSTKGYLTSLAGAASSTLYADYGTWTGGQVFGNATATQATTTNLAVTSVLSKLLKTNATGGVIGATAGSDYENPLTFSAPLFRSTNAISWYGLATTSQPASSNILVSNGTNGVYGVATSTLSATSPLTGSFTQIGSGGSLGIQVANGSQNGYLASGDWTTFNNKQNALGFTAVPDTRTISTTYPLGGGGALSGNLTLTTALSTTTSQDWSGQNTFANILRSTTTNATTTSLAVTAVKSALHLGDANGTVTAYGGTTCTNQFARSISALGAATCATVGANDVSLANLSATDQTLTFSGTYNGSVARTIGLNLGNANTWTGGQIFGNSTTTNATTTSLSATTICLSGDCKTAWPTGGGGPSTDKFATSSDNVSIYTNAAYRLGIGTSTPQGSLTLASSTPWLYWYNSSASANKKIAYEKWTGDALVFGTSTDAGATTDLLTLTNGTSTFNGLAVTVGSGATASSLMAGTGTSTFSGGVNLTTGCYGVLGTCIGSGGSLTGAGTANYVPFWTSANNLSNDSNFQWDNTNKRLGIGSTTPYSKLSVAGVGGFNDYVYASYFIATSTTASSTFGNGINLTSGCFAVGGVCIGGGSTNAVGGTGAIQFANGTNFNGDATKLFWDNTNSRLGIGSSTPWGTLSIIDNIGGPFQPGIVTATSTVDLPFFGWTATTSDAAGSEIRIMAGNPTRFMSHGDTFDQMFLNGRINTGDWKLMECANDHNSKTAQITSDITGSVMSVTLGKPCGDFSFIEDANGVADFVVTQGSGYVRLRPGATGATVAAGDGMGLAGTTAWLRNATNTPVMEAQARIGAVQNATSGPIMLGFSAATGVSADWASDAQNGCFFVASSTKANWQAVCRSTTATIVDTGVASSTVLTGDGSFYAFRVEMHNQNGTLYAVFRMRSISNQNWQTVATISTNMPSAISLNPIASVGKSVAGLADELHVNRLRVWYKEALW